MTRKPIGVWVLLRAGESWCYDCHATLGEAMKTARAFLMARTSLVPGPLFTEASRVWIAPAPQIGRKPDFARFRRTRAA